MTLSFYAVGGLRGAGAYYLMDGASCKGSWSSLKDADAAMKAIGARRGERYLKQSWYVEKIAA